MSTDRARNPCAQTDWLARFGFPLLLLEAFVDPTRFVGTIYRAANWQYVGDTRGYRRTREGYYSNTRQTPKRVFVQTLQRWNAHYGALDESLAIDGKTM